MNRFSRRGWIILSVITLAMLAISVRIVTDDMWLHQAIELSPMSGFLSSTTVPISSSLAPTPTLHSVDTPATAHPTGQRQVVDIMITPDIPPNGLRSEYYAAADITLESNGITYITRQTSRFFVFLDDITHPRPRLQCKPDGVIGLITNGTSPNSQRYPIRFEGVRQGRCELTNGDFHVTIVVQ